MAIVYPDHVVIFPHVVKYIPQSLVDNFPKVIRQINSAGGKFITICKCHVSRTLLYKFTVKEQGRFE